MGENADHFSQDSESFSNLPNETKAMFCKKEKWEERKGRGEKWRENEKLGCLVGGKNREKRKLERKPSEKLVCFKFTNYH